MAGDHNVRNFSGVNASDDDRIFRIAEELRFVLRSRRQIQTAGPRGTGCGDRARLGRADAQLRIRRSSST